MPTKKLAVGTAHPTGMRFVQVIIARVLWGDTERRRAGDMCTAEPKNAVDANMVESYDKTEGLFGCIRAYLRIELPVSPRPLLSDSPSGGYDEPIPTD